MTEPDWLIISREVQAIAQNGLTFSTNLYDVARYHRLRDIVSNLLTIRSGEDASALRLLHAQGSNYAVPEIDVRAAVFDEEGRILLVSETLDAGRWTLPGGWADVNLTTVENAVKEVREESGYDVVPVKLAALWDRVRQGHRPESSVVQNYFTYVALRAGSRCRKRMRHAGQAGFRGIKF